MRQPDQDAAVAQSIDDALCEPGVGLSGKCRELDAEQSLPSDVGEGGLVFL